MGYRSGCYSRACVRSLLVSWRTHTHTRWRVGSGKDDDIKKGQAWTQVCVCEEGYWRAGRHGAAGRSSYTYSRLSVNRWLGCRPQAGGPRCGSPLGWLPRSTLALAPRALGRRGGRSACRVPHARRVDCVDCPRLLLLPLPSCCCRCPSGGVVTSVPTPCRVCEGNNPIDVSRWEVEGRRAYIEADAVKSRRCPKCDCG